jgi:hypothetical protein
MRPAGKPAGLQQSVLSNEGGTARREADQFNVVRGFHIDEMSLGGRGQ